MAWTINDLNASINRAIRPVVIDTVFHNIVLIHLLNKMNKVVLKGLGPDGYVDNPIVVDRYETYSHDNKMGTLKVPVKKILGYAKTHLATRYGSLELTREDSQILDSDTKVIDTLKVRSQVMTTSLLADIEYQMFNQTAVSEGYEIDSLDKIVDDGSKFPEYAGVPRATTVGWKSYVKDMAGAPITYDQLLINKTKAKIGNETPNLIFASEDQWIKIYKIVYDKQHYQVTRDDYLYGVLGMENFKIGRAPVVSTSYLPAGTILFLNLNFLQLNVLEKADEKGFTFQGFKELDLRTVQACHFFWDGQLYGVPRYHSKIINAG